MDKFKQGDIVSSDVYGDTWKNCEVMFRNKSGSFSGWYQIKQKSGDKGLIPEEDLYLSNPKPSPIRETTRKELVTGTYGIVRVYSDFRVGIVACNETLDPINLREAAHTLNQIAEYLESKGK